MKNVLPYRMPCWYVCILLVAFLAAKSSFGQSPCSASVPAYTIDLTGNPAGVWSSPNVSRNSQCCSATSPDQCIYFYLKLDSNAVGIQIDMIGADPAGSLFYQVNCAGSYPGGMVKCISGVGPHKITFCKPGGNKNIYKITSVSRPLFPKNDTVRIGCKKKLISLGVVNSTVVWQSIYPGAVGAYNGYLDSLNVASPTYSPALGAPAYVDYRVCGYPIASACGFSLTVCDTVRIYNYPTLSGAVSPNPATFCNNGPGSGVLLSANASGGLPAYTYSWKNSSNIQVGTGANYFASAVGTYNLEIKDRLYNSLTCPSAFTSVSVSQGTVPVVDAGPKQKVCASNPIVTLSGSVMYASGGVWSGGGGSFSPGTTYLNANYTPSAAELSAGFAKLYLTSTGAGGGCANQKDSVIIYYSPALSVSLPAPSLACNNSTVTLIPLLNGGTLPYTYHWSTGAVTPTISAGQGNYSLLLSDSVGCSASANVNLVAPAALSMVFSVNNVSSNGGTNGTAMALVSGGTPAYSVTWTPGAANSFSIAGLSYGVYSATVKDAKGCMVSGSTVVNEPRCLAFTAVASGTNVLCNGGATGAASVSVSGGTPAYSYSWNTVPVQNSAMASGLKAGVYSVKVTDINGCIQTANITVSEPATLTNVMTFTNVSTVGGSNGAAAANPFGGTPTYTYLWNNGGTNASINGLVAGTYSVALSDAHGCVLNDSVKVKDPTCSHLLLNVLSTPVSCNGGTNGSAQAVVSGAVGSYSLTWSTGSTSSSILGLAAGNYFVNVRDAQNCVDFVNFTITQPSVLSLGLLPVNTRCYGLSDGTIDATVAGGTYPYQYLWSNGATSQDLINLGAGTFSLQVTDQKGCAVSASASVAVPSAMSITPVVHNTSCIYGQDGSIQLTVSGGVIPYAYTWSTGATTPNLPGLAAGGYTVVVKDANNCSQQQPLILPVQQPDSVKVDSFRLACSVPGSAVTQVTVVPSGGSSGSYQVSFDNGANYAAAGLYVFSLPNNATYSVTLKDGNNCTTLKTYTLHLNTETSIDSVAFARCYAAGTSTIPVRVYASGGLGASYQVSFTNGLSYLAAGTYTSNLSVGASYTVYVKDGKGCVSAPVVITLPAILTTSVGITSNYHGQALSCFGSTDASVAASVSGGAWPYAYVWSSVPTQTTALASGLGAGVYTLTVSDANHCVLTNTVMINPPAALSATTTVVSNYNGANLRCYGDNTGSANVVVSGGVIPYTYSWSSTPSQTTAIANGLGAGTYTVTVSDDNLCSVTRTVALVAPPAVTSSVSVVSDYHGQAISCNNSADGSASVSVYGGTGGYTYSWSTVPAQTGATATGLSAGIYTVTIQDANHCIQINTISIVPPPAITNVSVAVSSDYHGQAISCYGATDGLATLSASGGTGVYTYSWSTTPVQTTATAVHLGAGTYTDSVMDVNQCSANAVITLVQPSMVTATASVVSDYHGQPVSCYGSMDGAASVMASGGTGGYTYAWSSNPVQASDTANGLGAGVYTVTVQDVNLCAVSNTVILSQPAALSTTVSIVSDYHGQPISCNDSADGSASVSVSGGTGAYGYAWSTAPTQSVATATGLAAGIYTVVVNDANHCMASNTVSLSQPPALGSVSVSITSDYHGQSISCFGSADGSAMVSASGGTGGYSYAWSTVPVQTTAMVNGLAAGTYTVVVTDSNHCSANGTITLLQPSVVSTNLAVVSDYHGQAISCQGSQDGSAGVTAGGGTPPYTYSWSTAPTQTTAIANGLGAGTYTVIVKDVNLCSYTQTITLNEPSLLSTTVSVASNYNGQAVSCYGSSDGSVSASVQGGTGAYTYSWSTVPTQTTAIATGLTAGTYTVIVQDVNFCLNTRTVSVIQPTPISNVTISVLSDYHGQAISCYGQSDGSAGVSATGGTGAYTYSWSTVPTQSTAIASGLAAGVYTVVVNDVNHCGATATVSVVQPSTLSSSVSITSDYNGQAIRCYGGSDGAAQAVAIGGTGPYTYTWSSVPAQTGPSASGLAAGSYSVWMTDLNGCQTTNTVVLIAPSLLTSSVAIVSNYHGQAISCYGLNDASASVSATGGTGAYSYTWSSVPSQTTALANHLGAGTYTATVSDQNLCLSASAIVIQQPSLLTASTSVSSDYHGQNISCYGRQDGAALVNAGGGVPGYTYSWSTVPAQTTAAANGLAVGMYTVTVWDQNLCQTTQTIVLNQPAMLTASAVVGSSYHEQAISCFGNNDGLAVASASGGTGVYAYTWSTVPSQTIAMASGLGAGTYTVSVSDINNCVSTATVVLTQPNPVVATASVISNYSGYGISCFGLNNGAAGAAASGGVPGYVYSWSTLPVQLGASAGGLIAGVYTVQVSDLNNCLATATVVLTQPAVLTASAAVTSNYNGQNISCYGLSNGSANASAGGGAPGYIYSWSTIPVQPTAAASGLSAGVYTVTVSDQNSCVTTTTLQLNQPTAVAATASVSSNYNGQNISCYGLSNGLANAAGSGGIPGYSYSWSTVPVQSGSSANSLSVGSYTVTVADANGCSATAVISLSQPPVLTASVVSVSNYNGYNISCNGLQNGAIDVSVAGGTGQDAYLWSSSASTQDLNGVGAGTYSLVVTDANGCQVGLVQVLTEPSAEVVMIDSLSEFNGYNIRCHGGQDGGIGATVSGGAGNYTYSWSNSAGSVGSAEDLNNVPAGSYTIVVTDQNNCSVYANVQLIEPPLLSFTSLVTSPLCNGVQNGAIDATVTGGVSPITYQWSNSATTQDLNDIGAGIYVLTYTDADGCVGTATVSVDQPQALFLDKTTTPIPCYGDSLGSIAVAVSGGSVPYSYLWSTGATGAGLQNIGSGTYVLIITDAKGCMLEDTTYLSQPDSLHLTLYSPQYTGGYNISTYQGNDGSIQLSTDGGINPYTYLWSNSSTDQNLNNLVSGSYTVIVTDANGCQGTAMILLREPLVLEMPSGYSPNHDGQNDVFIIHGIEAYPDNTLTVFNRWGNVVYSKTNYQNEWVGDGNQGERLPDATYFVILEINKGAIVLKGYVELRR